MCATDASSALTKTGKQKKPATPRQIAALEKARAAKVAKQKAAEEAAAPTIITKEAKACRRNGQMIFPEWLLQFQGPRDYAVDYTVTRMVEDGVAMGHGIARILHLKHGDRVRVTIEKVVE